MRAWWISLIVVLFVARVSCADEWTAGRTARFAELYDAPALASVGDGCSDGVDADMALLRRICGGLDEFIAELSATIGRTRGRLPLPPADDEGLRRAWATFLRYGAAALSLVERYEPFFVVEHPDERRVLLGYGAAMAVHAAILNVVAQCRQAGGPYWEKLDDGDASLNVPTSELSRLRSLVCTPAVIASYERGRRAYAEAFPMDERTDSEVVWLHERLAADERRVDGARSVVWNEWVRTPLQRVMRTSMPTLSGMEKAVGMFFASTKYQSVEPAIDTAQLRELALRLQPGDVLVYRKNWHVSSALFPGFWSHLALWAGSPEELVELGLADDARVAPHLSAYAKPDEGNPRRVVEAIEYGVVMSSLERNFRGDYLAVLRPKVSRTTKAEAIARAFSHVGKDYDFNFNFLSTERLICTELVWQAYGDTIDMPLWPVLGRPLLAPGAFVEEFGRRRGTRDEQFDFICFIDSDPATGRSWYGTAEDFVASTKRRGLTLRLGGGASTDDEGVRP